MPLRQEGSPRFAVLCQAQPTGCYTIGMSDEAIVCDPAILGGKPVIRGTRMPVALVVGSLTGGMSFEDVQREYGLSVEDIRAALKFAGALTDSA